MKTCEEIRNDWKEIRPKLGNLINAMDAKIDETGEYEAEIVKITPLPAIDLGTGRVCGTGKPPYFSLFVSYDFEEGEKASFPIIFCPMCGKRLGE